jgi:hypothetical protein
MDLLIFPSEELRPTDWGRGVDERATTASKETKKERTELIKIDKETNRRILEKVYYI